MNKLSRLLILPAALFLAAAAAQTQAPAVDAKHGKELFINYTCYACHGFSGQNGNGARLVPMKLPETGFIAYIRNPRRGSQMPPYSAKVIADRDLADIYAYIKTLPDSAPPPASVPVLSRILKENQ